MSKCGKCGKKPLETTVTEEMIIFKCFYCGWRKVYVNMSTDYMKDLLEIKENYNPEPIKKNTLSKFIICYCEARTGKYRAYCRKPFVGTKKHKYCPECKEIIIKKNMKRSSQKRYQKKLAKIR